MPDIVIVGGGPAGLTTALALAHSDRSFCGRVVVLEKARYPRDKYCAGALGERGDKILRSLDASPNVPGAVIDGISFRTRSGEASALLSGIGRVVRRIEFDHALALEARRAGVEIREGVRVDSVRPVDGGAVVATSEGDVEAGVVVGADGVGSAVRKAIGLGAGALRAQVLELDTEPVPGDRDRRYLHFDAADARLPGYAWDFPTVVAGEPLVCRGVYKLRVGEEDSPADLHALLGQRLARMGLDITRYKNKRYAERGFEPGGAVASGPMLLVGEAAGIDPVTGEGIAQAIEFGALAGRFLARVLDGRAEPSHWSREVSRSRLARDLRIRHRFVSLFYGPARPALERFFVDGPSAVHVGCQHFAAEPYDRMQLADVLARGAAAWLGLAISRALGGSP